MSNNPMNKTNEFKPTFRVGDMVYAAFGCGVAEAVVMAVCQSGKSQLYILKKKDNGFLYKSDEVFALVPEPQPICERVYCVEKPSRLKLFLGL